MVWSKRKPYYNLKLTAKEFFTAPVRYLRDYVTKESILEKPYEDEDRGDMHQKPPKDPGGGPPYDPRKYPPRTPLTPDPEPLPPPTPGLPTGPRKPFPGVDPDPDPTQGGIWVQPLCFSRSDCGCLNVGESCLIFAAANKSGSSSRQPSSNSKLKTQWKIENSDPGAVSASFILIGSDRAIIKVTALKEVTRQSATITVWGVWGYKGETYDSRCGWHYVDVPCCGAEVAMAWDYVRSIETLARNASGSVEVTDGIGPFTWTVSGTGFTLAHATTPDRDNILIADGTACGSATIVVTDSCGNQATGYVRSTEGTWDFKGNAACVLTGEHGLDMTMIQGKFKQVAINDFLNGSTTTDCSCTDIPAGNKCSDNATCDGTNPCGTCVTDYDAFLLDLGSPWPATCSGADSVCAYYGWFGQGDWHVRSYCITRYDQYEWECS